MKIAIDVVLIPDENTIKKCKEINSSFNGKIDFNKKGHIPHISLFMGVIEKENLDNIFTIISKLPKEIKSIKLTGKLKESVLSKTQENCPYIAIESNKTLSMLFLYLKEQLKDIRLDIPAHKDMFYKKNNIEDITYTWVDKYKNKELEKNFHITLGIGEYNGNKNKTFEFNVLKIAVFQLGNYCTCKNKFFEIELKKQMGKGMAEK